MIKKNLTFITSVKFVDAERGEGACIMWGRIWKEDIKPLESCDIIPHLRRYGAFHTTDVQFCSSLHDVAQFPYFYEYLWEFTTERPRRLAEQGILQIYFLGYLNHMRDYFEKGKGYRWER